MIAKTRCRLFDCSEKPATNSAGATVAPSARPVSADAEQDQRLIGGQREPEHDDPGREQHHADQRQVVHRPSGDDEPEHDGHHDGAAEFGQVQQPDVDRAVGLQQHVGRQRGRRHRCGRGEQRDADAGDRDRTGEHRADGQQRAARPELVDDQHHDQGQAAEHRHGHGQRRRSRGWSAARRRRTRPRSRRPPVRSRAGRAVRRDQRAGRRRTSAPPAPGPAARSRRRSRTAVATRAPRPARRR